MKKRLIVSLVIIGVLVGGFIFLELGRVAGAAMINVGWI